MGEIEFTREDLMHITETYTMVQNIEKKINSLEDNFEKNTVVCTGIMKEQESRIVALETWKEGHIGEEIGRAQSVARREGAKTGGVVALVATAIATIILKFFGVI